MERYLIAPFDVLIFGDGKPFNAGEQHNREINFFLNPVPFVSAFNKSTNSKVGLNVLSLYNEEKQEFLFPSPFDIGFENDGKVVSSFLKKSDGDFISSEKIEFFVKFNTDKKMKAGGKFINTEGLINYLLGKTPEKNSFYDLFDIITNELTAGIEIDKNKRTTKEKKLYFQPFLRFNENVRFFAEFNKKLKKEFLTIGGEAKAVKVFKSDKAPETFFEEVKERIKEKIQKTKLFKIILLTPTNYPPEINGAKKIAQLTGKIITFSGWYNIYKENKKLGGFPTRLFKLIPEGSVFYYRLEDESMLDEIFNNYWLKPRFYIHELPYFDKNSPIGFGLTIISAVSLEGKDE
ncbi:type III-B CRISPR module-associated Cmr3 family protein [Hydrogenivirga sp. 128-5-R1-1]|uniref:type III-B CRISPR module-associated Cmr3 family protein n=1 Tax=Hydrogenivirga sp. 128-5-R1-1 TaxID=392423 RepID=UPI00015EFDFB|nr:type III-B CRISPR module-associated Cmr3 family protein [Hydrogenivirga sp. 128-5-R1-1]EDP73927.1 hypothetical protein HG1285_07223 [Hydrogenivirga sp. 128-5-R1-1]